VCRVRENTSGEEFEITTWRHLVPAWIVTFGHVTHKLHKDTTGFSPFRTSKPYASITPFG
jgi:hypothetical protein